MEDKQYRAECLEDCGVLGEYIYESSAKKVVQAHKFDDGHKAEVFEIGED